MRAGARDAVREDDVGREEDGVREGEGHARRLALQLHVDKRVDADDGKEEREEVAGVRMPIAARTITGRNSIAATVPSGSRSIAR